MWYNIRPMNTNRTRLGAAVLNGCIYVAGGLNKSTIFSSVECYNKAEDKWYFVTKMTTLRCSLGLVALNGYLYALGGLTSFHLVDNLCIPDKNSATSTIEM